MRLERLCFAAAAVLAALAFARSTDGCGPDLPDAVFTLTRAPDRPLEFAAGRLGVIQPTFSQAYLVSAYRTLRGLSLDARAQRALLGLPDSSAAEPASAEGAYYEWLGRRHAYPGADSAGGFSIFRALPDTSQTYSSVDYTNCLADAFAKAGATLAARLRQFGPNSPWLAEWIRGQDRVFANCSSVALMPAPVPAEAPPIIRADRDYQIAAAFFYAGHFDRAVEKFDLIARDTKSPWQTLAPYLAARALTRKGTLRLGYRDLDVTALAEAEKRANRVLATPKLASTHDATRRLLGFISFRLHPEARLRELSRALSTPRPPATLRQDIIDLTLLFDRMTSARAQSLAAKSADYDLADWVLTFQAAGPVARTHALERWKKTHAVHWLVAAARHVRAGEPDADAVLHACAEMRETSPAYATLQVHRVRMLLEAKRTDDARATLDRLLQGSRAPWPPSGVNLLLAERFRLANSLDEFVAFAPREPAAITEGWVDGRTVPDSTGLLFPRAFSGPGYFDYDAMWLLDRRMPLATLEHLASAERWPANLRAEVATAAFVRALLLERDEVAKTVAAQMMTLLPQTKGRLGGFVAASDAPARRFEAALFLLDFPGAMPFVQGGAGRLTSLDRMDPYRNNWWCALPGDDRDEGLFSRNVVGIPRWGFGAGLDTLADATWLGDEERAAAADEQRKLAHAEAGPNWICRQVVAWGRAHPTDPRLPRALYLAVEATHYGCHDTGTTALSKQAYQLLHARFPQSEWAKKTPHYY